MPEEKIGMPGSEAWVEHEKTRELTPEEEQKIKKYIADSVEALAIMISEREKQGQQDDRVFNLATNKILYKDERPSLRLEGEVKNYFKDRDWFASFESDTIQKISKDTPISKKIDRERVGRTLQLIAPKGKSLQEALDLLK